jgi:F-type H+-transporting ATPase subunit delta
VRQTILAKRYAKALFAVGQEEGKNENYREALNVLGDFLVKYPEAMDALTNLLYPMELREKVMSQLIGELQADQYMANFLKLVVQKKRADILPEIATQFQALVDASQNVSRGTVIAALEISGELQAKVQATLENITGKKVILTTEIDPAIIGGIVAKVGDLVMDGSIKTQLAGLNESIKGSE